MKYHRLSTQRVNKLIRCFCEDITATSAAKKRQRESQHDEPISGKILSGSTALTDGWAADDALMLKDYDHYRVFHSENKFDRGKSHVNGIERFLHFANQRLAKCNGCASEYFAVYLTLQSAGRGFGASRYQNF
ncbi:MAG: hypothetical protein Ta2B_13410 [Termitinemataceae bacterium]|nr:MAG: hypothetical protein Ta2B_13410 [Termitinemataceae bacterium]